VRERAVPFKRNARIAPCALDNAPARERYLVFSDRTERGEVPDQLVTGYVFAKPGDDWDGTIVQIIARVDDPNALVVFGCAFFIWFAERNEVKIAESTELHPWFDFDNLGVQKR
jgi:hypothetical protein